MLELFLFRDSRQRAGSEGVRGADWPRLLSPAGSARLEQHRRHERPDDSLRAGMTDRVRWLSCFTCDSPMSR